jgi:hypothetical protein
MTKRRENQLLEAKIKEWDRAYFDVDKWFDWLRTIMTKISKDTKYNVTNWLDLYFHDKNLTPNSRFIHRFWVVIINIFVFWLLSGRR